MPSHPAGSKKYIKGRHPGSAKQADKRKAKRLNLALQGGGSHGAFTWGVLERLLEEDYLEFEGITGTSAGAMNGVILAQGMMEGGRVRARELLGEFWYRVSRSAAFNPLQPDMMDKWLASWGIPYAPGALTIDMINRMFSPSQLNMFDVNPLRDIVEELVNFEALREQSVLKLFVNATNVLNGKIKVFRTSELTLDMIMASACLPFVFKTVEVDGVPYWDGGYSGNPAIYPLFYDCSASDVAIIQINPVHIDDAPQTAPEILDRVNEISFNNTLMREMRAIAFVKKLLAKHEISDAQYKDMHVHLIEAEELMNDFSHTTKNNVDWEFLRHLHNIGYQAADEWLAQHYEDIGKRSSIDIDDIYL